MLIALVPPTVSWTKKRLGQWVHSVTAYGLVRKLNSHQFVPLLVRRRPLTRHINDRAAGFCHHKKANMNVFLLCSVMAMLAFIGYAVYRAILYPPTRSSETMYAENKKLTPLLADSAKSNKNESNKNDGRTNLLSPSRATSSSASSASSSASAQNQKNSGAEGLKTPSPRASERKRSDSSTRVSEILTTSDPYSDEDLEELYHLGTQVEEEGEISIALRCYLACLSSKSNKPFPSVTLCLRRTADIFFRMGEFEKAAKFLNAEKLIYENALLGADNKHSSRAEACAMLSKIMANEGHLDMAMRYRHRAEQLQASAGGAGSAGSTSTIGASTPFDGVNSKDDLELYAARGKLAYIETMRRYQSEQRMKTKH